MFRLTAVVLVVGVSADFARSDDKEETAKEAKAILQMTAIKKAAEVYYINPNSGNKWPEKLDNLVKPPWGGASLLANGKDDLIDPWGKGFKYELAKRADGETRPFVWTERTVDKKTKVIGTKPPEKKKE